MGRDRRKKGHDTNRDSGAFSAMPHAVLLSAAYTNLGYPAKVLLHELALQYKGDNNGRLLASRSYLATRGIKSPDVIGRALKELMESGLIHQTVMGHFPKTASWYAVTWRTLDRHPGYDHGVIGSFVRGAYRDDMHKNASPKPVKGPVKNDVLGRSDVQTKNDGLSRSGVQVRADIATGNLQENHAVGMGNLPINPVFNASPCTGNVHLLEVPSTGARQRAHAHHDDCVNHAPDHGHETHAHTQPVHAPGSPSVVPWDGQTCNGPETRTGVNDDTGELNPMVDTDGRGDTNGRGERLLTYTPAPCTVLTIDSG